MRFTQENLAVRCDLDHRAMIGVTFVLDLTAWDVVCGSRDRSSSGAKCANRRGQDALVLAKLLRDRRSQARSRRGVEVRLAAARAERVVVQIQRGAVEAEAKPEIARRRRSSAAVPHRRA
jgi:hypothetical protein